MHKRGLKCVTVTQTVYLILISQRRSIVVCGGNGKKCRQEKKEKLPFYSPTHTSRHYTITINTLFYHKLSSSSESENHNGKCVYIVYTGHRKTSWTLLMNICDLPKDPGLTHIFYNIFTLVYSNCVYYWRIF